MRIDIQRIMVPTDFSENAEHAYAYAEVLAKRFGAKLLLTHVGEIPIYPAGPGQIPIGWENLAVDLQDQTRENMKTALTKFQPDVEVETLMSEGTPFLEIVRMARDHDVDMIVMSTHGHTGIKNLLLGSTAAKVVRKAACPVLTVHPGERTFVLP